MLPSIRTIPVGMCSAGGLDFDLLGDPGAFAAGLGAHEVEPGLVEVTLRLTTVAAAPPPTGLLLRWTLPGRRPQPPRPAGALPDFTGDSLLAKTTIDAPVLCLHAGGGGNRMCAAWDDAHLPARMWAGVDETDGAVHCHAVPLTRPQPATCRLVLRLRVDLRRQPWHEAIAEVRLWWAAQPGPSPVPLHATGEPLYSTWYALHQDHQPESGSLPLRWLTCAGSPPRPQPSPALPTGSRSTSSARPRRSLRA